MSFCFLVFWARHVLFEVDLVAKLIFWSVEDRIPFCFCVLVLIQLQHELEDQYFEAFAE